MMGFSAIKKALDNAGADVENMAIVSGHTEMPVPISLYAPDTTREQLLGNMTLPVAAGNVRTGTTEYYVPNESSDLTQYISPAINPDDLIDNTKIAPAIAETLEIGSLDEASKTLFNLISSTDAENGRLSFPAESLLNGYTEYYPITYTSTDGSLCVDRNANNYLLNGQKQSIAKIGNHLPLTIFVVPDRETQDEGSFYVPKSVLDNLKAS